MDVPDDVLQDLLRRLRKAEGQIRGIQQMLTSGRECGEVVTQLAAARTALGKVGFKLLVSGMAACIADADAAAELGFTLEEVERLFSKLS